MISYAYAANAAAQPNGLGSLAPMILIMVAAYFLLLRPMSKQKKAAEKLASTLEKNDEVVLSTGIVGKITKAGEQFVTVEIAPNVEITVQRHAQLIAQKLEKGSLKKIAKGELLASATPAKPEPAAKKDKKDKNKTEEVKPVEEKAAASNVDDFAAKADAMSTTESTEKAYEAPTKEKKES